MKGSVLVENSSWLVVNKPTGISTHSAHAGDLGVAEWLALHGDEKVYVCSRLDKGTSGVLPLARTVEGSAQAERIHAAGTSRKTYHLVVDQRPPAASWTENDPLDGQPAKTHFFCEQSGGAYYLLRAEIDRGRKHQIRRHAARAGVPIVGDDEYGGSSFPRLCLHCSEVDWPGEPSPWKATMPDSFSALLSSSSQRMVRAHAALERRGRFLDSASNAYRLIHRGECDGMPVAIDRYGDHLLVTGFDEERTSQDWLVQLEPILDLIAVHYGTVGGIIRTQCRDPHRRSLFVDAVTFGQAPDVSSWVREGGLEVEVMLNDAQHPGLFLDQRDNRRRMGRIASGKRVANLFAFTASFSAVAVQSRAEVAFSIDLAQGSLDRGKRTFARNGLNEEGRGKFIAEDVRSWLARQNRKREREGEIWRGWDLVICDPPVFAGGGRVFSVEKEWLDLAESVQAILARDGQALFCNNHQAGSAKKYQTQLEKCFADVHRINPPLDFPRIPGQPEHVRMFWCANSAAG